MESTGRTSKQTRLDNANRARAQAAALKKAADLHDRGWIAVPAEWLEQLAPHEHETDGSVWSMGPAMTEHLRQVDPDGDCSWCTGYVTALADLLKLHRKALGVE